MYYLAGFVLLAIQVYLAVHAYNSGRERWIFLILFIPLAGAVVYLIVAWIPDFERRLERRTYGARGKYGTRRYAPARPRYNRPSTPPATPPNPGREPAATVKAKDPTEKLKQLKRMLDEELITEADYEAKKAEILARM